MSSSFNYAAKPIEKNNIKNRRFVKSKEQKVTTYQESYKRHTPNNEVYFGSEIEKYLCTDDSMNMRKDEPSL